jgi:signal transduction histidine kinase
VGRKRASRFDSGIGIPEAMLPRIFDRFLRADPSRSEVDGAGLGLAIVKWIADVHHGVISVQSREGEGTIFAVTFRSLSE